MSESTKPASTSITTTTKNTRRKEAPLPDREVDLIVVHCTDTTNGRPVTISELDAMHRVRDNGHWRRKAPWATMFNPGVQYVGYHFVITIDGAVHQTRHLNEIGVHVKGKNARSIGISMVGRGEYTRSQWHALKRQVQELREHYPKATVHGHRDFANKECPCFNVGEWIASGLQPLAGHIHETIDEVLARVAAEERAQASLVRPEGADVP